MQAILTVKNNTIRFFPFLKADRIPRLVVLNKCDVLTGNEVAISELDAVFPDAIKVSAKTKDGFENLLAHITEVLLGTQAQFRIPMEQNSLVELARKNGTILQEDWQEDCILLNARIPGTIDQNGNATTRTLAMLMKYLIQ